MLQLCHVQYGWSPCNIILPNYELSFIAGFYLSYVLHIFAFLLLTYDFIKWKTFKETLNLHIHCINNWQRALPDMHSTMQHFLRTGLLFNIAHLGNPAIVKQNSLIHRFIHRSVRKCSADGSGKKSEVRIQD